MQHHAADAELVRRCLAGDRTARDELACRVEPLVLRICQKILGRGPDAEDTAQEVFLRVFKHLDHWDGQRPLAKWVAAIAVNRCRTALARRARLGPTMEVPDGLEATTSRNPNDFGAELTEVLQSAVAKLRPEYQTVIRLFHLEERSLEEVARIIGRPVGTVKTWLHRARSQLARHLLAAGWGGENDWENSDCPWGSR